MQKSFLLFVSIIVFSACAPKIRTTLSQKYEPLDYKQEVMVIELADVSPVSAELLGTLKIGDAGMSTKCNYAQVLEKAKEEARKVGGNAVKITEHKTPDFMSSCHRISAQVLRLDNDQIALLKNSDEEIDPTIDYALLYVYRNGGGGALVGYNLYQGDSILCRVTNRFKQEIRIKKTGQTELWAKTESKAAVPVDFKKGRTYYLRCSVGMGIMVGRPSLELVSKQAGSREFSMVKTKSK